MYRRLLVIVFGMSLAVSAARANDILQIAETGEGFNDLVATYNGAPLSIMLSGTADAWTVQLPTGYAFGAGVISQGVFLNEPENPLLFDQVNIPRPTFLTWISDIPVTGAVGSNSFTFAGAGTAPGGKTFDLVLSAGARRVPDGGSTIVLLASGLAVLAMMSRQWLQQGKHT
ncbi:MAG: hypothetical protein DLM52_00020 [Chthoniobacterales bacterium]|nr:MAG: hypothetical protein DLM52_00020 [Chthoniobacterales bacterium]